jgi:hypothetical protein
VQLRAQQESLGVGGKPIKKVDISSGHDTAFTIAAPKFNTNISNPKAHLALPIFFTTFLCRGSLLLLTLSNGYWCAIKCTGLCFIYIGEDGRGSLLRLL